MNRFIDKALTSKTNHVDLYKKKIEKGNEEGEGKCGKLKIVKCLHSTSSNSLFVKKENLKIYNFHKIPIEIRSNYIRVYSVGYENIVMYTTDHSIN